MEVELVAITPESEKVIEAAARTCYQSAISKGGSVGAFIQKLIQMGHESPLEHGYATFRIDGCSRTMTHQLVRHRLMSVSQKSQRYVTEDEFQYIIPPAVPEDKINEFRNDMDSVRMLYSKWKNIGLKKEDARFFLPNACATEIVISANFREFRHIFKLRCSPHAQWEIRQACTKMLRILNEQAPFVFGDIIEQTDNKD